MTMIGTKMTMIGRIGGMEMSVVIAWVIVVLGITLGAFGVWMQRRNEKLYMLRRQLGQEVYLIINAKTELLRLAIAGVDDGTFRAGLAEVERQSDMIWNILESESYSKQFWSFWIPVERFGERARVGMAAVREMPVFISDCQRVQ